MKEKEITLYFADKKVIGFLYFTPANHQINNRFNDTYIDTRLDFEKIIERDFEIYIPEKNYEFDYMTEGLIRDSVKIKFENVVYDVGRVALSGERVRWLCWPIEELM